MVDSRNCWFSKRSHAFQWRSGSATRRSVFASHPISSGLKDACGFFASMRTIGRLFGDHSRQIINKINKNKAIRLMPILCFFEGQTASKLAKHVCLVLWRSSTLVHLPSTYKKLHFSDPKTCAAILNDATIISMENRIREFKPFPTNLECCWRAE